MSGLTCQRIGCDNTFPPTVRRGNRGGRKRRFCSNVCAVAAAAGTVKRGGTVTARAKRTYRGEQPFVATMDSTERDRLGRVKTLYRFGRTPDEAEQRLFDAYDDLMDEPVALP